MKEKFQQIANTTITTTIANREAIIEIFKNAYTKIV